jgi:hypothetical protein
VQDAALAKALADGFEQNGLAEAVAETWRRRFLPRLGAEFGEERTLLSQRGRSRHAVAPAGSW